jgi:putative FmdB family regulatory protein
VPTYCYHCEECDEHFEAFHSMKSIETVCKVCGANECLTRVPSMPTYFKKNNAGSVVKQHIEDAKQQLVEDRREAREEFK